MTWRCCRRFQSTPSARRATQRFISAVELLQDFNPRPPRGGRQQRWYHCRRRKKFQSTPSARRATKTAELFHSTASISIHALREEGDPVLCGKAQTSQQFQSTPSARRATHSCRTAWPRCKKFQSTPSARRATSPLRDLCARRTGISIHALREEGDDGGRGNAAASTNFNPRPPRGGRLSGPW